LKEVQENKNKKKEETKEVDYAKIDDTNSELNTLRKELEEKTKLADEYLSRLKYLQADFENYKKMEERERKTYEMNANEILIKNLLPIIDSFEIAIELAKKNYNKLGKEGLKQIIAVGKKFDPYYNEVTMTVINNDLPEDTVVEEHERGYMLGSKVIRTSKVKVSKIENHLEEK
jgi:molecular chaperone GrpE